MAAPIITQAQLIELLEYFPDTGLFVWRVDRGYNSNRIKAGAVAGWIDSGYVRITINQRTYRAHRLVWLYCTGTWPTEIDHIDGDKSNNRRDNLRNVTRRQNLQNMRVSNSNNLSSGLLGVSGHGTRWRAHICLNGKKRHIGYFLTPEEAHAAYVAAKRQFHPFGTL